jgi:hypothetical protein
MRTQRNLSKTVEITVLFGIFIIFVLILFHVMIATKAIINYVNQPIYTESTIYHKCGGTKKEPIMCATIVREKINENN